MKSHVNCSLTNVGANALQFGVLANETCQQMQTVLLLIEDKHWGALLKRFNETKVERAK